MEAAQHQRVVRQAPVGAPGRERTRALAVVGLVAVRHLRQLLAEVRGMLQRREHRVADQVVDVVGAAGAGKAQPVHLNRGGAQGHDLHHAAVGGALHVDQDVDLVFADRGRHVEGGASVQVDEVFGRVHDAPAQRGAIVNAGREQRDLETIAVVRLEHLHRQLAGGVLVEVGRQVADAQAAGVGLGRTALQRCMPDREVARVQRGDLALLERVVDQHGVHEGAGLDRRAVGHGLHRGTQPCHLGLRGRPSAGLPFQEHEQRARRQFAGAQAERERRAHALGRFGLEAEFLERHAHAKVRDGVVDLQRQCLQERLHGLVVPAAALQRHRQRDVVDVVARRVRRQRLQHGHGVDRAAELEVGMRLQRVGDRQLAVLLAQALQPRQRTRGLPGLDGRVRGRQCIGRVADQIGGLVVGPCGGRPLVARGERAAVQPPAVGAALA